MPSKHPTSKLGGTATKPSDAAAASETPCLPSKRARRIWSLVLFVHVLAVALSVSQRAGNIGDGAISDLREDLGNTPLAFYTQLMHLDSPYEFYLTGDDAFDYDHVLELLIKDGQSEESQEKEQFVFLPAEDISLGIRRRRYGSLAKSIAFSLAREEDPLLASYVAKNFTNQIELTSGIHTLKCWNQIPIPIHQYLDLKENEATPGEFFRYSQIYHADLIPFRGQYMVKKVEEEFKNAAVLPEEKPNRASSN